MHATRSPGLAGKRRPYAARGRSIHAALAAAVLVAACETRVEGIGGEGPPPPDALASSVEVTPAGPIVADGEEQVAVVVTVRNAAGEPLEGRMVELAASGSGNTLTQPAGPTAADGTATGTLASTVAELKTIGAVVDPGPAAVALADQPTVEFVGDPDAISASLSTLSVAPASHVAADGLEQAQVVVTVRDVNGNPVAGVDVELAATGSANVLTQPGAATGADGVALGALASTAAETKTLSARVRPGPGEVALDDRPSVTFAWVEPQAFFVRLSGQDPADCSGGTTPATAWRTLSKAAACAPADATVHVGAGLYQESVHVTGGGAAGAPLRFVADTTGARTGDAGEVLVDALGAPVGIHVDGASWVELVGFTLRGAAEGVRVEGGTDVVLRDLTVHSCTTGIHVGTSARVALEHARVSANLGRGVELAGATDATILDSLVYANGAEGVLASLGATGVLVRATTLYANLGDQVAAAGSGVSLSVRDSLVVLGGAAGLRCAAGSTLASDHNDLWGNAGAAYDGAAAGPGDLALDPHLVDPAGPDGMLGGAEGGDDGFHLSVPLASPAFDAGAGSAASVADARGLTLAQRTSRVDGTPDGSAPDGTTANLGFHYDVPGVAPAQLAVGDARIAYGEGSQPRARVRTFDAALPGWSAEAGGPPTEAAVRWVRHALSPLASDEELLGLLAGGAAGTRLDVLSWTGVCWERLLSSSAIAGANLDRRGFDLAYESASGDALVVYSVNGPTPAFRARSAGVWSDEALLPLNDGAGPHPDTNAGVVQWVELAARPGVDEVALAFADSDADLVVLVWDGAQWLTSSASVPCTDLTLLSGGVRNRTFDLAWEGASGELLAAWGRGATNGFWWAQRPTGGGPLGAAAHVAGAPGFAPNTIDLAPEPGSDRVGLAAYDLDAKERLGLAVWDGTAWVHAGEYDSINSGLAGTDAGDLPAAVAWVGTSGEAVCVYPDTAAGKLDWATWRAATGWVVQGSVPIEGKAQTASVQLLGGGGAARVIALIADSDGRLWAGSYDGSAWSVTAPELEPTLSSTASLPFAGSLRK